MCERTRHNKHYKQTFHDNIAHFVLSITGNHEMKHKTFGISRQETGDPGFISHKAHSNAHMRLCCNHGTVTQSVRWLTFEITKQLSERGICCTVTPGMDLQPDALFIKKKKGQNADFAVITCSCENRETCHRARAQTQACLFYMQLFIVHMFIFYVKEEIQKIKKVTVWQPNSVPRPMVHVAINYSCTHAVTLIKTAPIKHTSQSDMLLLSLFPCCWQCTHFPRSYYGSVLLKGMFPVCHCVLFKRSQSNDTMLQTWLDY